MLTPGNRFPTGFVYLLIVLLFPVTAVWVDPPRQKSLHNISVSIQSQIDRSVLSKPKAPRELRVAFMSNCFFRGAVRNGNNATVLPESHGMVARFDRWLRGQEEFDDREVTVFNASVDGTSILDHIAIATKLTDYGVDAIVIAMTYTEFRTLPLHPLLGSFSSLLESMDLQGDPSGFFNSRGRWISFDFQRWLTARKYQLYRALVFPENMLLWNNELRTRIGASGLEMDYRELYGGQPIPIKHIGLGSRVDQEFRKYLPRFLEIADSGGAHVVLVNQPIRFKGTIEVVNPELFEEHRELLRSTAERRPSCSFIDLDAMISVEDNLSDYIHLTFDGTLNVSQILNPELKKILAQI